MLNSQNLDASNRATPANSEPTPTPTTIPENLRIGVTQSAGKDPMELAMTKVPANAELPATMPIVTFQKAQVDQPRYLVLTVPPEQLNTSVRLTIDTPQYFQLATDSHPTFVSSLVLTPLTDKYVHLRYNSERAGVHTSQLLVDTPDASYALTLKAQSVGMLPSLGTERIPKDVSTDSEGPSFGRRWLSVGAVVLLGCLIGLGYGYRCELFPSLCSSASTKTVIEKKPAAPVKETAPAPVAPAAVTPAVPKPEKVNTPAKPLTRVTAQAPVSSKRSGVLSRKAQPTRRPGPAQPVTPNQESDLEKILNQD